MRIPVLLLLAAVAVPACSTPASQQNVPPDAALVCDPDNGGISLPEGFCAFVVADTLGSARHVVVRPNGDIYVSMARAEAGRGVTALRDEDGDGRADRIERFGPIGGTGLLLRDNWLYFAPDTAVYRWELGSDLLPASDPETIVTGFPLERQHGSKPLAADDAGNLYVGIGAPANACQEQPREPGSPGKDPCPLLDLYGGVWRFAADRQEQTQAADGYRFATGLRSIVAIDWYGPAGGLYAAQHGRDQLSGLWPDLFTEEQSAELPAEELVQVDDGDTFGWPYCFYDQVQKKLVLAPEYGGDGKEVGRCSEFKDPVAAFPGHWAPNDLIFYDGNQFPSSYRGGAFIVFHGSWNRAPMPQAGFRVVFQPFSDTVASDDWTTFADGFAGAEPLSSPRDAVYRPTGIAQGPDGSLYIVDSRMGRLWRVIYRGV